MNSAAPLKPEVAVLAAGASARLGRNKALVKIRGKSVLSILLAALSPFARGKIVVVARRRSAVRREALRLGARCIVNPAPEEGMSQSVRCALLQLRHSTAILLLPVDLVALESDDLARLVHRWRGSRRRLVARRLGSRGVTPVILPKHLYGTGARLHGDTGLRQMIAALPACELALVPMPSAHADLDTTADLAAARRRFRVRDGASATVWNS